MTIRDDTRQARTGSFGWMIQRLSRRINETMNARLEAIGLSINEFAVMMVVLENGPMTQSQIGSHFGMPAYAISRALDRLVDLTLVARNPHPTSRRALQILPTAKGEALAPRLHSIVAEVNDAYLAPLDDGDREVLLTLLQRVVTSD